MRKKTIIAAATAAFAIAGFAASANAMPTDTTVATVTEVAPATDPVVDTIAPYAGPGKVTLSFVEPNQSIEAGEEVTLTVTATNDTGNPNPDVRVTLTNCGTAVATPSTFDNVFSGGDTVDLVFTITGLDASGICTVSVQSNHGGANFDANGSDSVTITVTGGTTTTTTVAPSTTEAESAAPVTGSSSAALAVMALGFVLIGWATTAATRRRLSA